MVPFWLVLWPFIPINIFFSSCFLIFGAARSNGWFVFIHVPSSFVVTRISPSLISIRILPLKIFFRISLYDLSVFYLIFFHWFLLCSRSCPSKSFFVTELYAAILDFSPFQPPRMILNWLFDRSFEAPNSIFASFAKPLASISIYAYS